MKVRLKRLDDFVCLRRYRCFNSMKVRLKQQLINGYVHRATTFQFHEGPIKTLLHRRVRTKLCMFQFHEGPIKTGEFLKSFVPSLLFQFHEGPIKTVVENLTLKCVSSFNSMKVRLKLDSFDNSTRTNQGVSIP